MTQDRSQPVTARVERFSLRLSFAPKFLLQHKGRYVVVNDHDYGRGLLASWLSYRNTASADAAPIASFACRAGSPTCTVEWPWPVPN